MKLNDFDACPDGAAVLDEVHAAFTKYVIYPSPEAADAVTLWTAATHAQPAWQHATRLVLKSAEKRSGKTRTFDVARELVHNRLLTVSISPAALARSIDEADPPTIMVDEADRTLTAKSDAAEVLNAILNAGFARGVPYTRWDPSGLGRRMDFDTFAMVALATKGADMADTVEDRAVMITMRRRRPDESVTKFRTRDAIPALHEIRERLSGWIVPNHKALTDAIPAMPDGLDDRAEDLWEPLLAVADLAAGKWPKRARKAAVTLASERADADRDASYGVRLLGDIRDVLTRSAGRAFMPSKQLLSGLKGIDDAPWSDLDLTARGLSDRLRGFGIRPGHNTSKTARGYRVEAFADAFARYLDTGSKGGTSESVQPSERVPDQAKLTDAQEMPDASNRPAFLNRPNVSPGQPTSTDARTVSDDPPLDHGWPDGSVGAEMNAEVKRCARPDCPHEHTRPESCPGYAWTIRPDSHHRSKARKWCCNTCANWSARQGSNPI